MEARTGQRAASRPGPSAHAAEPPRPSPYDLYIGFGEVQALWACESDHPEEVAYRCALQSIEMGLALLADATREDRPAGGRAARLEAIAENILAQVALARRAVGDAPLPPALCTLQPADSPGVRALRRLGPDHAALAARVTDALLLAGFPTPLGIEPALAEVRADLGLSPRDVPEGPCVPYARWVQPERVAALVERAEESPEDRLFATVHQMCECWLRLVLEDYARAGRAARGGAWEGAAEPLERASEVLAFLARHVELLHLMVVADYHPLRVQLRGASGAQSAAARVATVGAREFLPPVLAHLEARGLTVLDVFRFPHDHPGEHRYLEALGSLERRLLAFYFTHFQLARKVLGTKSLGSLGYEVKALAERFLQPLFPELDEARYDHTMLTNLAHGHDAGRLIAEREDVVEAVPPTAAVAAEVARNTLQEYFAAISALDLERWVALFDAGGTMEDPVGSRPHRGLAELRVFFQGVQRTFARLTVTPGEPALRGARAAVGWAARGEAWNGRRVAFEGTEFFDLTPDGRILAVRVVWDPRTVVDQLLPAADP